MLIPCRNLPRCKRRNRSCRRWSSRSTPMRAAHGSSNWICPSSIGDQCCQLARKGGDAFAFWSLQPNSQQPPRWRATSKFPSRGLRSVGDHSSTVAGESHAQSLRCHRSNPPSQVKPIGARHPNREPGHMIAHSMSCSTSNFTDPSPFLKRENPRRKNSRHRQDIIE